MLQCKSGLATSLHFVNNLYLQKNPTLFFNFDNLKSRFSEMLKANSGVALATSASSNCDHMVAFLRYHVYEFWILALFFYCATSLVADPVTSRIILATFHFYSRKQGV